MPGLQKLWRMMMARSWLLWIICSIIAVISLNIHNDAVHNLKCKAFSSIKLSPMADQEQPFFLILSFPELWDALNMNQWTPLVEYLQQDRS